MPIIRSYKIFVSHSFRIDDEYARLLEIIETSFSLPHSIASNPIDPKHRKMTKKDLEGELRRQIGAANCFIALDGLYLSENDWARYELEYAVRLGKPIIAIREWKSRDVSTILHNVATAVLGWNPEKIADSIAQYSVIVPPNFKY